MLTGPEPNLEPSSFQHALHAILNKPPKPYKKLPRNGKNQKYG